MPDGAVRPRLALRVGVTGHRWRDAHHAPGERLDPAHADAVRTALRTVLTAIREAATQVHATHGALFTGQSPKLSLLSALAEGADTLAAEVALEPEVGYVLDLVVPYDLAAHAARCAEGTPARSLWDRARARFILDGVVQADEPADSGAPTVRHEASLVETNRRLVWNSDLIIAVWDGHPSRGEAGTAHVIARAHEEGLPVVHIHAASPTTITLLDAPGATTPDTDPLVALRAVVRRLLEPPQVHRAAAGEEVQQALRDFATERPPGWVVRAVSARVYKVVLWVLTRFDRDASRAALVDSPSALAVPWGAHQEIAAAATQRAERLDPMFRRADYFATSYGHRHRSTFTTILFVAPLAVWCAWRGSVAGEHAKLWWAIGEFVTLVLLVAVFLRSRALRFQARWLDYRLLAERLRHHGFLWPLGRGSPVVRVPTHAVFTDPRPAWVNWWYRAVIRALGLAHVTLTPDTLPILLADVRAGLLEAQARYNAVTHRLAHHAEHRLHLLPWLPLTIAIVAAAAHVVGDLAGWHPSARMTAVLTGIGIVGPAFSAALHGFASQAGFQEIAIRTDASAQQIALGLDRLAALDAQLDRPLASKALGDLTLEIADVMGEDLAGWRVDYLARPLNPPG